ncbi:TPA-induced transmembrane protein isoform X2 [Eleutherodactylus coqui]|uniref:TPA-induced transmembrane protein isoform X2 n=1 Tax=Eleutherodactylus coqui TaxID=57060 RepID=UPI003461EA89
MYKGVTEAILSYNMDPNQNNHKELLPLTEETTNNEQRVQKKHGNKILNNPKLWIGLVFILLLFITIISLILYSNVYIDEDEHNLTNLSSNGTCSYIGFVSVTNPYLWDLWIKNETLFQERITSIYSKSTFLNYFFLAAKVNYNSTEEDKSVILHLDFAKPSKSMKYPISIELLEGLLRQNMYDLEKYERQDSHNLKESLQVTVISM